MELWIRSQDREMLCKVECVELMHDDPEYAKIFLNGQFPDLIVGAYEKKRALEVLDEIQKLLVPDIKLLYKKINEDQEDDLSDLKTLFSVIQPDGKLQIHQLHNVIYQMPQE